MMSLDWALAQFKRFVRAPCVDNRSDDYLRRTIGVYEVFYEFLGTIRPGEDEFNYVAGKAQKVFNRIKHDNPLGFYYASHSVVMYSLLYALDTSKLDLALDQVGNDIACHQDAKLAAMLVKLFTPYLRVFYSNEIITMIALSVDFMKAFPIYSDSIPLSGLVKDMHNIGMFKNSPRAVRGFHNRYVDRLKIQERGGRIQKLFWPEGRLSYKKDCGPRRNGIEPKIVDDLETWDLTGVPIFSCSY